MSKLVNNGKSLVCHACLELKSKEEFHDHKFSSTGKSKYCKVCGVKPGNYRPEARYNKFTDYQ